MFDKLIKELQAMDGTHTISVPLENDADGYYDRECPSEPCLFNFKIHGEDWKAIVRDEEVFCPSCRHAAPAKSWYTREQIERGKEYAFNTIKGRINKAMREDATAFNRRQKRGSFITMSLSVKGQAPLLIPVAAAEPMRLRTQCEQCQCRYSYIGAAFFCPSCGANSADHTFAQTLNAIRSATGLGDTLRNALDRDEAEVAIRTLLEKAMQDAVMSFQRLAEQLYARLPNQASPRRNAFQNLNAGSQLWETATGKSFAALTDAASMEALRRYFQQRHLLAHSQGIVDQDYIDRSGDRTYVVGQRLVILDDSVREFADLVERLGRKILETIPR